MNGDFLVVGGTSGHTERCHFESDGNISCSAQEIVELKTGRDYGIKLGPHLTTDIKGTELGWLQLPSISGDVQR